MMPPKKKKLEFTAEVLNYLELNFHLPADTTTDSCLNGHVFLLYAKNGRFLTITVEQVNKLFEVKATYEHVMNLVQKSQQLVVNYSRPADQQNFEDFCKESFINFMTSNNFNVKPLCDHREFLASNFTFPAEINTSAISCLNGHALNLYYNENRSAIETSRQINTLCGLNSNRNDIDRLLVQTKNWIKSFNKAYHNFEIFCYEPLVCTILTKPTIITSKSSSPTHLLDSTQCKDLEQPSTSRDPTSKAHFEPTVTTDTFTRSTVDVGTNTGEDLLRLARENLTPREIQLKKRLSYLSQQFAVASKNHKSKVTELKSKLKDMPQKLKVLNQRVKRKNVTLKALKKKIHELKKNENRKNIPRLKVKKYASDSDWKIKHADEINSNKVP